MNFHNLLASFRNRKMQRKLVLAIIIGFSFVASESIDKTHNEPQEVINCKYGYHTYKGEPKIIRNGDGKCQEPETELFLPDLPGAKIRRSVCCLPPTPRRYFKSPSYSQSNSGVDILLQNYLGNREKREAKTEPKKKTGAPGNDDLAYMAIGACIAQVVIVVLAVAFYFLSNGKIILEMPNDCNRKLGSDNINKNDLQTTMN